MAELPMRVQQHLIRALEWRERGEPEEEAAKILSDIVTVIDETVGWPAPGVMRMKAADPL